MKQISAILAVLCLWMSPLATADTLQTVDEDRAREIGKSLRCVVCQNQSIEDSDAQLAADLRALVRTRIAEGDTDAEIVMLIRDRYGDFVLLKPPVQTNTYVLWFMPLILVGLGAIWLFRRTRSRPQQ